jgi:hypothetical protein
LGFLYNASSLFLDVPNAIFYLYHDNWGVKEQLAMKIMVLCPIGSIIEIIAYNHNNRPIIQ